MNFRLVGVFQVFLVTATFLSRVSLQTVTKHPDDVLVNVDDAAWLNCSFGEVLPTYTLTAWQKDGWWFALNENLISTTNHTGEDVRIVIDIDFEQGKYNIRFTRVALEDHGLYKCGVHNATTDSYIWSNEAKLTVHNFIQQPSNVTAVEGETILLPCHVNVMPAGSYLIWEKDYIYYAINDFLIDNDIKSRVLVEGNHTAGEYNLLIGNLALHDSGVYSCGVLLTNSFRHWSDDATLTVLKDDTVTATSVIITTRSSTTPSLVAVTSESKISIVSSVETPTSALTSKAETSTASSVDTPTLLMTSEVETTTVPTTSAMTTMDYGASTTTEGKSTTTNIVTSRKTSTVSPSTQSDMMTSSTKTSTLSPSTQSDMMTSSTKTSTLSPSTQSDVVTSSTKTSTLSPSTQSDVVTSSTKTSTLSPSTQSDVVTSSTKTSTLSPSAQSNVVTSSTKTSTLSPSTQSDVMTSSAKTSTLSPLTQSDVVTSSTKTSTVSPSIQSDMMTSSTATNTEPLLTETQTREGDTTMHTISVTNKPAASFDGGVELWIIIVAIVIGLLALIAVVVILRIISSRVRKQGRLKKTEKYSPNEQSLETVAMKLQSAGFVNPIYSTQETENTTRLNDSNDFQSTVQIEGQVNESETVCDVPAQPLIKCNSKRENATETENSIQNEEPLTKEITQTPENSPDLPADVKGEADIDSTIGTCNIS